MSPAWTEGDRVVYLGDPPRLPIVRIVACWHPAGQTEPVYFVDFEVVPSAQYRAGTAVLPARWVDGALLAPVPPSWGRASKGGISTCGS